ncbi:MAG: hypothetical protein IJP92_12420, partial [Lachnospiraceae bacterium]|nr:hypothetical protein [Lachnospiraceae bacterium]
GGVPTLLCAYRNFDHPAPFINIRYSVNPLKKRLRSTFYSAHSEYYHRNVIRVKYFFKKMTFALFRLFSGDKNVKYCGDNSVIYRISIRAAPSISRFRVLAHRNLLVFGVHNGMRKKETRYGVSGSISEFRSGLRELRRSGAIRPL